MSNLYEIDSVFEERLRACVDPETGEITDLESFELLKSEMERIQMDEGQKIENIALSIKNDRAFANALKEEKKRIEEALRTTENKIDRKTRFLEWLVQGRSFKTPKFVISFRKSVKTIVDNIDLLPGEYLKFKDPEPDKDALKRAMKGGTEIPGCHLETVNNISIK